MKHMAHSRFYWDGVILIIIVSYLMERLDLFDISEFTRKRAQVDITT